MRNFFKFICGIVGTFIVITMLSFFVIKLEKVERQPSTNENSWVYTWFIGLNEPANYSHAFEPMLFLPVLTHNADFPFKFACEEVASAFTGVSFTDYAEMVDSLSNDMSYPQYWAIILIWFIVWCLPLFIILGIIFLIGDIFIKAFV